MQLKRYTDYALRVLIYLGAFSDQIISINEIARAYGISRNHLLKVVNGLLEQGLIRTYRGKTGGLQLALAPDKINVGKVVRYMEGNARIMDCHEPTCPILPVCNLKDALSEAHEEFYKSLRRYTLADLLKGKQKKIVQIFTA
jgi:Rrf2 family nitric oxide-sensitive transcriptional repressor